MKTNIIKIMVIGATVMALCSCKKDPKVDSQQQEFMAQTEYGFYSNATALFKYDNESCQIGFNASKRTSRIQTDDMSAYVSVGLATDPVAGKKLNVNVKRTNIDNLSDGTSEMKVVKTETNKLWLWNQSDKTGLIIYWE